MGENASLGTIRFCHCNVGHIWSLKQICLSWSQDAAASAATYYTELHIFTFHAQELHRCPLRKLYYAHLPHRKDLSNFSLQQNHCIKFTETIRRPWAHLLAACLLEGEVQARARTGENAGPVPTPRDSPRNQSHGCWCIHIG